MKIFVSYRSVNRPVVNELVSDLTDMGHEVWYDQELEGGQRWWDNILDNIRACDLMIFALTPQSLESYPCQLEYTYANALRKPIIPALLEGDINVTLLPMILQERQIVDYRAKDKAAYKRLDNAIENLPPAPALPDPLPQPPAIPVSPLAQIKSQIDAPVLDYQAQVAVFHQLKHFLENPEYASDARELLTRLSQHPALIASVYKDIEAALAAPPARREAPAQTSTPQPQRQAVPPANPPPAEPTPDHAPSLELADGEAILKELTITLWVGGLTAWANKHMVITNRRLIIQPPSLALFDKNVVEIAFSDIVDIKKAMQMIAPVVEIKTHGGDSHKFAIPVAAGMAYGNREELIAFIQNAMRG